MSDPKKPNTPAQTDKSPPLPDLERDVEMVAGREPSPPTVPEDSSVNKSASDLEAVLDVPVHVSAVLGRTRMDVGDLLKLGPGTVLELDRKVGESIDIFVNNRLVARGEVVLVEERLGVTMTEIIKAERS
jgi:flagellar motor switch protein FliN/FliY